MMSRCSIKIETQKKHVTQIQKTKNQKKRIEIKQKTKNHLPNPLAAISVATKMQLLPVRK